VPRKRAASIDVSASSTGGAVSLAPAAARWRPACARRDSRTGSQAASATACCERPAQPAGRRDCVPAHRLTARTVALRCRSPGMALRAHEPAAAATGTTPAHDARLGEASRRRGKRRAPGHGVEHQARGPRPAGCGRTDASARSRCGRTRRLHAGCAAGFGARADAGPRGGGSTAIGFDFAGWPRKRTSLEMSRPAKIRA